MNKIITLLSLFTFLFIRPGTSQSIESSEVQQASYAEMEFEQERFNFGTVAQGEKVKNVFVFTNTSDIPLVISNARGSCGCTVPEWPKEPIMPGESSQLLVVFDSKGKKGVQAKKVSITANTEKSYTFLILEGVVETEKKPKLETPKNRSVNPDFFNIYPNPTSEMVSFSLSDYVGEKAVIEIFDNTGKLMTTRKIDQITQESIDIDLINYNSGIYAATIVVGEKMRLAKQFVVR